ncbi:regucalcin-like [Ylistrum balloti]|uniref:regucalcin-like n=1 Tax=Ylistrum balloti TaxID=509963 RepID=UPI0029059936|nr:regucalcin-like [Ylistrum balloti]
MSVSVAIPNVTSQLGEGPHWEEDTQTLLFVDSLECKVYRWNSLTKDVSSVQLGDTVGSVVPFQNGGYLAGVGRTISHFEWNTGVTTKLQEVSSTGLDDRFNDGKCDPAGRFWTGTMGSKISYNNGIPVFEQNVGSLYSLDKTGALSKHFSGITVSNGLAWSSDERVMFYIDTGTRKVEAFTYDVESGEISDRRDAITFETFPEKATMGWPDGMTIDTEGHLWVACFGVGKVICFDPATGTKLTEVNIPAPITTSCCFGGKNLDELYITTAPFAATEQELQQYPSLGSVFKVTGLGVKGRPANVYQGDIKGRL